MLRVFAYCSGRVEQVPLSAPCFWRGLLFLCTFGSAGAALSCDIELGSCIVRLLDTVSYLQIELHCVAVELSLSSAV